MIPIANLFFEIGPPFRNSLLNKETNKGAVVQGRSTQTVADKEGVRKSREKNIVEPTPNTQGFKPSGIVT